MAPSQEWCVINSPDLTELTRNVVLNYTTESSVPKVSVDTFSNVRTIRNSITVVMIEGQQMLFHHGIIEVYHGFL